MAFKLVFTPHPVLAFEARRKEREVPNTRTESRKDAERTLETLQEIGNKVGIYKIVPADYRLRDV